MHRRNPSSRSLKPARSFSSAPLDMSLPMPLLSPMGSPKIHRVKHRTALVALFFLLAFTCYLLFVAYPSLEFTKAILTHVSDRERPHMHADNPPSTKFRKVQQQLHPVPPARVPLSFTPAEELAALCAFIAALPHNVLPPTVDPAHPLDPQLVLDFDPRSESAREELDRVVRQIWARVPVFLFTKLHSSDSREVQYMLASMGISPPPLIVEVDQREDGHVMQPLLERLTHVSSLPILVIGGQPVGAKAKDSKALMKEIRKLHEDGELARRILEAGARVESEKRKQKAKRGTYITLAINR